MGDHQRYATVVAIFATVLFAALLVAAFGMISLVTNQDVIADRSVGPLVGPSMTGAVVILVFVLLLVLGVNTPPAQQRVAVGYSLGAAAGAFLVFIGTGALLVAVGARDLVAAVLFAGSMLGSPFAIAVGVLAFLVTLTYSILLASHYGEHGRPLWPWERRGE